MKHHDRLHYRTCSLCEAMCGIEIALDGDKIVSIRGDASDPFSAGYICPKATALQDLQEDKDRLRHPVRKTAKGFERISWDEAFSEVAGRIREVQQRHGRNSMAYYFGNPTVHNYGTLIFGITFATALRSRNRFSATSVDQLPHHLAAYLMFGHQLLLPIPDVDRTQYFLILGANPVVSNGSLMTAPGMPRRLQAIRAREGKVVVIDPRRTETAEVADQHVFIRPGTDALFVLAMLQVLFAEKRVNLGRLAPMVDGLDSVEREVAAFTPERVTDVTGIPAEVIRTIAREFSAAPAAVAYGRMGASTQEFGSIAQWLINVLNIVTGNLDRPGGPMFTKPAVDLVALTAKLGQKGHFAKGFSRVRKLPEFNGEYPVSVLAEEILTEGEGQIRGLITTAGNPVLSTPNGRQLDRALDKLDFMASIDFYINETTQHADIILPPTPPLEHDHYDLVFHSLAVRNTAKYSLPLFTPAADTRHDWQIFLELATRLDASGPLGQMVGRATRAVGKHLTPERILNVALKLGPYGSKAGFSRDGLTFAKVKDSVHGIDLGALTQTLPGRLFNTSKKIVLDPEQLMADLVRAREKTLAVPTTVTGEGFDLQLIGRRQLRSNNSWMHNSHRLVKGRNRCTLLIHPSDAGPRSLVSSQRARVISRVGSIEIEVEVSDEVMPGIVSIPHGWGHDRAGVQLETAQVNPGASINDLTDELAVDPVSGNAALSGVKVRVEALAHG